MRKIVSRFTAMLQTKIVTSGFRWALFLLAHQQLNTEDFSKFAAAFSIIELARIFSDFGVEPYLYTKIGGDNKKIPIIWKRLFFIKITFNFIASLLLMIYGLIFDEKYYVYGSPILLLWSLNIALSAVSQKYELMNEVRSLTIKISFIALLFILLTYFGAGSFNHISIIVGFEAAVCVGFFSVLINNKKEIFIPVNFRRLITKRVPIIMVNNLSYTYIVQILSAAYQRADVLIVLPLLGSSIQSVYSAGYRFTEPFVQIFSILVLGILLNTNSIENTEVKQYILKKFRQKSVQLFFLISLIISLLVISYNINLSGNKEELSAKYFTISFILITPMRVCGIIVSSMLLRLDQVKVTTTGTILSMLTILIILSSFEERIDGAFILMAYVMGELINLIYQSFGVYNIIRRKSIA